MAVRIIGAAALAAGLLVSAIALDGPALAACSSGATATCDAAGNPYAAGITYNNTDQTVSLLTGVAVDTGTSFGVWLEGSGAQTLNVADGVTINTSGAFDGVLVGTASFTAASNDVTINASGSTVTTSDAVAYGYEIYGTGTIVAHAGDIDVTGDGSMGLYAQSDSGPVTITTGDVTAEGDNSGSFGVYGVYATSTAGDVSIDTTGGTVSLTGTATGSGITATGAAAVTVTTADVSVAGSGILTTGIWASSSGTGADAKVTVDTSAGDVTLTGTSQFAGIFAAGAGGPVEVTTAGVSTKAGGTTAVYAQSNGTGAAGAVTVNTTAGLVKTEGTGAIGINAQNTAATNGGLVTIHAGDITTTGTGAAHGIQASSTSGGVTVTAGTINTAGNGADGITASAGGAIDLSATKIVTKGDNAYGFNATGTGANMVKVTVGDVETGTDSTGNPSTGVGAHGVNVASTATETGLVDIESMTGSKITTVGKNARGINIDRLSGATTVHAGSIETSGANATGIHVYDGNLQGDGTGGPVTITAHSIVTHGDTVTGNSGHYEVGNEAAGIDVFNVGGGANGAITIDTSVGATPDTLGVVSVSGYKARGIVAQSGMLEYTGPDTPNAVVGGGAINITTGTVTTTGDFGRAIDAQNYGSGADGAITINALGTVSASGANLFDLTPPENEGNYPPNGIYAVSWGGGDVTITTKDVSSVGEAAAAISAQSGNGDQNAGIGKVTIDTTGGTISSKGDGAGGIGVGSSSGAVSITTADVKTEGWSAYGIQASNTGPDSDMTIDTTAGKITTTGKAADGIGATTGFSPLTDPNAGLLTIKAGDIDVEGEDSSAISASTYNGGLNIEVYGALTTGTAGATAINARADGTTVATVTIADTGSVNTTADNADGLNLAGGNNNTYTVTVNGDVKAAGATTYGVIVNGTNDQVIVNSEGSVYGTSAAVQFQESGGTAKVTNSGTLTGTGGTAIKFLGALGATFDFDNDGSVTGDVLMSSGNDNAILRSNSAITGNIDGKGGTDKL
ncbi:MAG TPA: hypothetical protein VG710_07905, partial [Opitutus sp.]|nr:hypothetical protein [Opitutus sp.]